MQDLIKIFPTQIGKKSVNTVNARDLWEFLGSGQEFAHWIKDRIHSYGFLDKFDYLVSLSNNQKRGKPKKEYFLSFDMAKELAMIENNEKGREVRRYFIEAEERLRKSENQSKEQMWVYCRELVRKNWKWFTDHVQLFVEEAEKQGSENATRYYIHFANMLKKKVGFDVRDNCSLFQLGQISYLEALMCDQIKQAIQSELEYHKGFELISKYIKSLPKTFITKEIGGEA